MKEVVAIIRMNKMTPTKNALAEAGFVGLTALKVMGRGKLLKDLALLPEVKEENRDMVLQSLLKGGRLIPKRLLSIVIPDQDVQKAVDTIITANQAGNIGDGKIFVLPVAETIRVRTGEKDENAL
ncbi:MAG TPA: P-II family nitrogen regulator [Desulfobacteria bacterium]|nr:P-II family nitrogen regulator [Desulfobacteria bacterium]